MLSWAIHRSNSNFSKWLNFFMSILIYSIANRDEFIEREIIIW